MKRLYDLVYTLPWIFWGNSYFAVVAAIWIAIVVLAAIDEVLTREIIIAELSDMVGGTWHPGQIGRRPS